MFSLIRRETTDYYVTRRVLEDELPRTRWTKNMHFALTSWATWEIRAENVWIWGNQISEVFETT